MGCKCKPVVIELPSGARYGIPSAKLAKQVYPNATIIGHQDGTPFEPEEEVSLEVVVADLTRSELNEYAGKVGIEDPESYPNKAALLEALQGDSE